MSLLSIIREVTGLLSLPQPTVVVGSTDKQVQQLFSIANEEGRELARAGDWEVLTEEMTFETINAAAQADAVPADLDRFVANSFFNRSTRRPITGPITPREWQWIQAQPVYSTVYLAFRKRTGQFLVAPTPPAGQTIAYEYVSLNWCQSAAEPPVPQAAFAADTDTAFLDEHLIALGVRWRYQKAKGFEYEEDKETYERERDKMLGRDGAASALSLAPQPEDLSRVNLPDGNFGL